jgi:polar amino acid transport system substrate-binding protein
MFKTQFALIGLAAMAAVLYAGPAAADLAAAKARGTLIVGVKADYKPYGYREPSGAIIGIEPDLAMDVANQLGLKLELVPVVSSNRMQFLQQGKIDLMIATMTDRPDRRKVVSIVDPNYYSSGTNVLAHKKAGFKQWADLKSKPVCGIQGAFYNKKTQTEFGADSFIVSKLGEAEWAGGFEMPLPTIDDAPWGLAVTEGDKEFHAIMAGMIENWHKSGRILELETKYGVPNTPFAKAMNAKYK